MDDSIEQTRLFYILNKRKETELIWQFHMGLGIDTIYNERNLKMTQEGNTYKWQKGNKIVWYRGKENMRGSNRWIWHTEKEKNWMISELIWKTIKRENDCSFKMVIVFKNNTVYENITALQFILTNHFILINFNMDFLSIYFSSCIFKAVENIIFDFTLYLIFTNPSWPQLRLILLRFSVCAGYFQKLDSTYNCFYSVFILYVYDLNIMLI